MLHVGKSIARTVQALQHFEILRKKWHEERERRHFDEDYTALQSIYRYVLCAVFPHLAPPSARASRSLAPRVYTHVPALSISPSVMRTSSRDFQTVVEETGDGSHDGSFDRSAVDYPDDDRRREEDP